MSLMEDHEAFPRNCAGTRPRSGRGIRIWHDVSALSRLRAEGRGEGGGHSRAERGVMVLRGPELLKQAEMDRSHAHRIVREVTMHCRSLLTTVAVAALAMPIGSAKAADPAKYPDWKGAWARFVVPGLGGQPSFDQTKPWGFGQEAPLTPEYRKVLEESLADQANGGGGGSFCDAPSNRPRGRRSNMK